MKTEVKKQKKNNTQHVNWNHLENIHLGSFSQFVCYHRRKLQMSRNTQLKFYALLTTIWLTFALYFYQMSYLRCVTAPLFKLSNCVYE